MQKNKRNLEKFFFFKLSKKKNYFCLIFCFISILNLKKRKRKYNFNKYRFVLLRITLKLLIFEINSVVCVFVNRKKVLEIPFLYFYFERKYEYIFFQIKHKDDHIHFANFIFCRMPSFIRVYRKFL